MSSPRHLPRSVAIGLAVAGWTLSPLSSQAAQTIHVDCARADGVIRPLHGVNGGPLTAGETVNLTRHWRALGVPITRLHDCEWPLPDVVDMHAVFPRPDADPQDPASYQFRPTDTFLQAIVDAGASIVYRLGESIEHSAHKLYVHPPGDRDRWAAACLGIIRHYNEGWADGFHHNIQYWEIWNEPENRPAMWSGTDDDYYRLYRAAAAAIKSAFPDLQVGGPSAGYVGELADDRLQPSAFLAGLLDSCRQHEIPMDFFSWHTYTNDPYLYVRKARAIRNWLDEQGFEHTRIHLNEWNYLPNNDWSPMLAAANPEESQTWFETIGGPEGAAFTACVLAYLQDSPVDVANYYSGDTNAWALFNRYGVPRKTYYAMLAFQRLLDTPSRLHTSGWEPGHTAACAGIDPEGRRLQVLLSNLRSPESEFSLEIHHPPWNGPTAWTTWIVDAQSNLEQRTTGTHAAGDVRLQQTLPAPGILLVALQPAP